MFENYHLVSYDYSIYNDLIVLVLILCVCMAGISFWLKKQKRSWKYLATLWGIFVGLMILAVICLVSIIHVRQYLWLDYFGKTVTSYAKVLMQFESWKIQVGQEQFFSDWSDPVLPKWQDSLNVLMTETPSIDIDQSTQYLPISEKLAAPKDLTAVCGEKTLTPKRPWTQIRQNEWAVVAITGDNKAFEYSTRQMVVSWEAVPQATTYRLQWQISRFRKVQDKEDELEWFDVYSGSIPSCVLDVPDKIAVVFRVRAENGTPEDDPNYQRLAKSCDIPVTANAYIGYVYILRPDSNGELRFLVAPGSDANHNLCVDAQERPARIGELYTSSDFLNIANNLRIACAGLLPEADEWGQFLSVTEPLWTPDGEYEGLLGFDFHAEILYNNLQYGKIFPYSFFVSVFVFFFGIAVFMNRFHQIGEAQKRLAEKLEFTVLELSAMQKVAESASRAKTLFLSNMSHELRTPLSSIIGFSSILSKKLSQNPDHEEFQNITQQIMDSGNELLTMINDILDFVVIGGEKGLKIELVPVNLRFLVEEIIKTMEIRVKNKPIKLTVSDNGCIPDYILCNPARIRQVLVNLIGNAIKFTEKGSIKIEYGVEKVSSSLLKNEKEAVIPLQNQEEKLIIFFSVSDTGIGIAPEDIEIIFHPFSQGDISSKRHYGGPGIGLSVSKFVAEMLGGQIEVSSVLGKGSTFTFTSQAWTAGNEILPHFSKKI